MDRVFDSFWQQLDDEERAAIQTKAQEEHLPELATIRRHFPELWDRLTQLDSADRGAANSEG